MTFDYPDGVTPTPHGLLQGTPELDKRYREIAWIWRFRDDIRDWDDDRRNHELARSTGAYVPDCRLVGQSPQDPHGYCEDALRDSIIWWLWMARDDKPPKDWEMTPPPSTWLP